MPWMPTIAGCGMDEQQTNTDPLLEALHRATNTYIETIPEMMQRAISGFADAYAELNARLQEALKLLDEGPQLGDTKLSYKQLQRLTPAERAEYARARGKGKKR